MSAHQHLLGRQCPDCRRYWALVIVEHPAGKVLVCRYCSRAHAVDPAPAAQLRPAAGS